MGRVLVTGATGFVGQCVARELAVGGCTVTALVRGARPQERLDEARVPAEAHAGDLLDAASVATAVRGVEAIVHVAAVVGHERSRDPRQIGAVNRDATVELARLARAAGVRRFVFVSSIAAMGTRSEPATVTSRCAPVTAYGSTKLQAERQLAALAGPGFDVVVLRPPTVYGPGERLNFLALTRALDRGLFRVIGDGLNVFPLCTTQNLARASRAAALGVLDRGLYLVADSEPYTIRRITTALSLALGRDPPRLRLPIAVARAVGAVNEVAASIGVAPLLLGRARVDTLVANQPFDVEPLLSAGVSLDAPLESWVTATVADYRRNGLLARRRA